MAEGSVGARAQWKWLSWALVIIIVVAGLFYGSFDDPGPQTDAERVSALAATIRCPQCTGQSVAESNVAIAREIRADIRRRVDAGESDDQIRAAYVARYDQSILLTPESGGLAGLIWVVPVVAGALGAGALALAFVRWRGDSVETEQLSPDDIDLVSRARDRR